MKRELDPAGAQRRAARSARWASVRGRRLAVAALALAVSAPIVTLHVAAHAQPYPAKPVRLVVPFTAGGSNDVLARTVGQKLGEIWGQPIVAENRAGAAGNIGAEAVAKAPADGYTFLIAPNNVLAINPHLYAKIPFDAARDFAPVTLLGTVPVVLVVSAALPIGSVRELVALAKSKPDSVTYASSGIGSPQHLSAELFASMAGVKLVHVPYKGAAPAVTDLVAGQVQMLIGPINSVLPYVRSGKLKLLGVGGGKRLSYLPDVPTIAEAGVPGYESDIWVGLAAPAGLPKAILDKVSQDIGRVLAQPDVREKLAAQGIEARASSPAEMAALVTADSARWGRLIREVGLRAE